MHILIDRPVLHDSFFANNENHEIESTGFAYSTDAIPALTTANFTDAVLNNYGMIGNTGGIGLLFTRDSTGKIYNDANGQITGSNGIVIDSSGVALDNNGTILGSGASTGNAGVYLTATSLNTHIDNDGSIVGVHNGIQVSTGQSGTQMINHGLIGGGAVGIGYSMPAGAELDVGNYGTIKGDSAAIATSQGGKLYLDNGGILLGDVLLELTSPLDIDVIHNHGKIVGSVNLGSGADTFDGTNGSSGAVFGEDGNDKLIGSSGDDVFRGGAGNESLRGQLGNDTLNGGQGNDQLHGGCGNDLLTGGGGHDGFYFDSFPVNSVSQITDFLPGIDHIMLSHREFHALSAAGHVLSPGMFHVGHSFSAHGQRIDYNPGNGWLIYDSNGSAAGGDPIHFATLHPHPHLTLHSSDFTVIA